MNKTIVYREEVGKELAKYLTVLIQRNAMTLILYSSKIYMYIYFSICTLKTK